MPVGTYNRKEAKPNSGLFTATRVVGSKNVNWKGNNASYISIHQWISRHYGSASRCESPNCSKKSVSFEYALLKGKEHSRKRENYWQLCQSCHVKYDFKESTREKQREARLLFHKRKNAKTS